MRAWSQGFAAWLISAILLNHFLIQCVATPDDPPKKNGLIRLLFVGNSMMYKGVVPHQVNDILLERPALVVTLFAHTQRAGLWKTQVLEMADPDSAAHMLIGNSSTKPTWDWVIFNEHSETPGLWEDATPNGPYMESLNALMKMVKMANSHGAQVLLVSNWGWMNGNPDDAKRYPDFMTMQSKISHGILRYAKEIEGRTGIPVYTAPGGAAMMALHNNKFSNEPKLASCLNKPLFNCMYIDHKHLSAWGGYLIASVISSTITGKRATGINACHQGMPFELRNYFQNISDRVVFEHENVPKPYIRLPTKNWEQYKAMGSN